MKVAFMGSDAVALPLLEHLVKARPAGADLQAVFTQPDRRTGRGMHLAANPVKAWALEHRIEVLQPAKCGADEAAWLRAHGIELVLVMAYGQILPRVLIDAPPLGTLNLHASLLPRLRGASPIQTAVALGLPETGVSLMRIVPKLDAGPVADAEKVAIPAQASEAEVRGRIARACVPLLSRCLPLLREGRLAFHEQDPARVSYCRIIDKTDCHLDFAQTADALANRVRAFQPWPGTAFPWQGMEIRVLEAQAAPLDQEGIAPGTLLAGNDGGIAIACGAGSLRPLRLQRPGGKPLATAEFLRGLPLAPGSRLESRPMQPLEAASPFPFRRARIS